MCRLVNADAGHHVHPTRPKAVPGFRGPPPQDGNGHHGPAFPGHPAPAQAPTRAARPSGPYDAERDPAWPTPG